MPFYVPLEVKDSPLEGKGLFVAGDIPAGTLYWSLVPLPGKTVCAAPHARNAARNAARMPAPRPALPPCAPSE